MSPARRILTRPLVLVLLACGVIISIVVVSAAAWFVVRRLEHRSMRRELNEAKLIEITQCGDEILGIVDLYSRTHGELPVSLDDLDLSKCAACVSQSAEYGRWEFHRAEQSDHAGLRFTLYDNWTRATSWLRISVGLRANGPGEWCAVRATPRSIFPDEVHHLRKATPK